MVDRVRRDDRSEPEYDIQLWRRPPETLGATFPQARMCTTPTQTAFVGQVRDPAQLDILLERLQSVGLVLDEIHRLEGSSSAGGDDIATYEVRVDGEIGERLLGYVNWRHYIVPEQTRVRIVAGSADLLRCLMMFSEAGATIERVRRVFPARQVRCA